MVLKGSLITQINGSPHTTIFLLSYKLPQPLSLSLFFIATTTTITAMTLSIYDLGEDILTSQISNYLSPEDIFKFFSLSKTLYSIYQNSSIIYQYLYNKKFTNNENNYTLSLQENLNWKQLFYLRCNRHQKVYTWGQSLMGRLGYNLSQVPIENRSENFRWMMVHTPTNINNFIDHIIVDIVATGFSFIILANDGELFLQGMIGNKVIIELLQDQLKLKIIVQLRDNGIIYINK